MGEREPERAGPAADGARGSHLAWALPCVACIGWAGACASLLYLAPTRTEVAWVVPLAWGWGATAIVAAWAARHQALTLPFLLALGVLVRAVMIGTPPVLSDDVYRYLWEGLVLLSGQNPFSAPPQSLPGLDDALRSLVNHPEIPSAYPPLGLAWFALLRLAGGSVLGAQALTALVDVSIVGALWLHGKGRAPWPALLYALHPLAALESASGAHIDVPAVACLAWAIALSRRGACGPFLATLGAGVKLFPALILPSLVWKAGIRRSAIGVTAGLAVILLAALPVIGAGTDLFSGLGSYATHWVFNGLLFTPLTLVLSPPDARMVLIPVGGVIVLVGGWWLRERPAWHWLTIGLAFIALSPTVHPWYGLWVLVPALFVRRASGAVIALSLVGGYGVLSGYDAATGAWSEPAWLWPATWLPALAAAAVEGVLALRRRMERDTDSARV